MTSGRSAVAVAATCVSLVALLYLLPSTGGRGSAMDEGAVVTYGSRVLDGDVPHRDFLTFYGPGNSWLVAGAFVVFGEGVGSERGVGMLYRLVIVLALFFLGLRLGGLLGAVLGGLVATIFLAQELIWAYATYGALAFGLASLALAAWGSSGDGRHGQAFLALAGVAGGVAMLVRFDVAPAVVLGVLPILTLVPARTRWWFAGGLLGPLAVYAVHLAVVGPERIARVVGDLLASGPGRSLPIPRPWLYPGNLLAVSGIVLATFLVVGALRWRRPREDPAAPFLVGIALFGLALFPYAMSRPDTFHIRPVAVLPLSLLPAFALYLFRPLARSRPLAVGVAAGVAAVTLLAVMDAGNVSSDRLRELRGVRDAYRGFEDDDSGEAVRAVVAETRRLSEPGDSLFVGPLDLRRTNYGPTYVYFLLRELEPASYYLEMNPGTANRVGSGLADDLRRADWLILTSEWDDWDEPNESMNFGPNEPNEVVRDDFCLRLERGEYRLYERCDRAA